MSDIDHHAAAGGSAVSPSRAALVDGLRAYMLQVYNYMALGLAITGVVALGIYFLSVTGDVADAARIFHNGAELPVAIRSGQFLTPLGYLLFVSPLRWAIMLAPLALVFVLSFGIGSLRPAAAQVLFWIFAASVGVSLAVIFFVFTQTSIVRVFFITAAAFGALSLWGYSTSRDLSGFGAFLLMALVGVILAMLVNLFLASSALQFVVSVAGVLVFAGLTAWDTQRLKNEYLFGALDDAAAERSAIVGALSLYLNFINLFTLLLQLLGQRDE